MTKLLLRGASGVGSLRGGISSDVTTENSDILHELAEFGVGEDELSESAEVLDGLLAILLHLLLRGRGVDVLDLVGRGSLNLGGVVAARNAYSGQSRDSVLRVRESLT